MDRIWLKSASTCVRSLRFLCSVMSTFVQTLSVIKGFA